MFWTQQSQRLDQEILAEPVAPSTAALHVDQWLAAWLIEAVAVWPRRPSNAVQCFRPLIDNSTMVHKVACPYCHICSSLGSSSSCTQHLHLKGPMRQKWTSNQCANQKQPRNNTPAWTSQSIGNSYLGQMQLKPSTSPLSDHTHDSMRHSPYVMLVQVQGLHILCFAHTSRPLVPWWALFGTGERRFQGSSVRVRCQPWHTGRAPKQAWTNGCLRSLCFQLWARSRNIQVASPR